ncbi:MAG: 4Fe-4S binding protein [Elusimicrobia bacterium]|nr:4Fe-4S binding protein [Elusimicrobiota bacterium]
MACAITERTERPFSSLRRWTIAAGMVLFLSPLALVPQLVGEVNMCGAVCPRLFMIIPSSGVLAGLRDKVAAEWFGASLVAVSLLVTFFLGRLWCGHLCPIGGASEYVSRLVPRRLRISFAFLAAPWFRYAYFAVFVAGVWLGIGAIGCKLCNYRIIPFLAGAPFVPGYRTYLLSSVGLAGLMTVVLTGFLADGGRAYCSLLCPVGALDGIVNALSAKLGWTAKTRTDPELCVGCGECVKACMVSALELDDECKSRRDQSSCMSCKECVKVCAHGAIRYGRS